jgi:tetratricopeptide (TPR) repeat protein
MRDPAKWILFLSIQGVLLLAAFFALGLYFFKSSEEGKAGDRIAQERKIASALKNNALYAQAVESYKSILSKYPMDKDTEANLSYTVASIYYENLHDEANALAWYLRAEEITSNKELLTDIHQHVVACLERMGRSLDAENALKRATSPSREARDDKSQAIALMGDRRITLSEIENEIRKLPPEEQALYQKGEKKLEFLKDYIVRELMVDTARRSGYDRDPDLKEAARAAEKLFMARKLYDTEVRKKIQLTDSDARLYYEAHKAEYPDDKGKGREGEAARPRFFEEVREQVYRDLARMKEKDLYAALVDRMMNAEKVVIFEEVLLGKKGRQ